MNLRAGPTKSQWDSMETQGLRPQEAGLPLGGGWALASLCPGSGSLTLQEGVSEGTWQAIATLLQPSSRPQQTLPVDLEQGSLPPFGLQSPRAAAYRSRCSFQELAPHTCVEAGRAKCLMEYRAVQKPVQSGGGEG